MAAPRKYTDKTLNTAVNKYFKSISREVPLTERKDSGQKDEMGHVIWEDVPVLNQLGDQIIQTEYVIPPTVGGLCAFLKIHRSTWAEYCDHEKHPEFSDTTTRAQGLMRTWNEEQLLTRSGKEIKGIIFNLENNYGYAEKQNTVVSGSGVEDYIRALQENGEGAQQF